MFLFGNFTAIFELQSLQTTALNCIYSSIFLLKCLFNRVNNIILNKVLNNPFRFVYKTFKKYLYWYILILFLTNKQRSFDYMSMLT